MQIQPRVFTTKCSEPQVGISNSTVVKTFEFGQCHVELENRRTIAAFMSARLRMNYVELHIGDDVTLELDPDNPRKGKIINRGKGK